VISTQIQAASLPLATASLTVGLYGAGQDILSDAFSGNLRGMEPGYAELEFIERPSEPVLCFFADKTEPGAWNLPVSHVRRPVHDCRAGDRPQAVRGILFRGARLEEEPADSAGLPVGSCTTCCGSSARRPAT
jgi:hypothetical protein